MFENKPFLTNQEPKTISDMKPTIRGPVVIGCIIIGLFFGIFGFWATVAPLNSAALALGIVTVESKRKTVSHLEGGIVGKIFVRDGDFVQNGQLLIQLDVTQSKANLSLLKDRLNAVLALKNRLISERDNSDNIFFSKKLVAQNNNPNVIEIMSRQERIFQIRKDSIKGKASILIKRVSQIKEEINGLKGEVKANNKQLELIDLEIKSVQTLLDKGLAKQSRLLALQRAQAEIEGKLSGNHSSIARAKQKILELEIQISELSVTKMTEVIQELREVELERVELVEKIYAAQDVLRRTEIRAPIAGSVVSMKVYTRGGVIKSGEPLMDIVPSGEKLVIEAQLDPSDIDVVYPGLPAQVRFTAFSQRNSVPVDGRIAWVSADQLTDERTGLSYYLVRVELTPNTPSPSVGLKLYPGMQAEVMIITGNRTPLSYLIKPITDSFNRALREQ